MEELYLSTKEAADILGVTEARVRQLVLSGELTSKKKGRDHLFSPQEIKEFAKYPRKKTGRPKKY